MKMHTVSEISQKGITRLISRFHREFSFEQTPQSLILQADLIRELTIDLLSIASNTPDKLGVFLSVLSGMTDIGVIYNMQSAIAETRRMMSLLQIELKVEEAASYVSSGSNISTQRSHATASDTKRSTEIYPVESVEPAEPDTAILPHVSMNTSAFGLGERENRRHPKSVTNKSENTDSNFFAQGMSASLQEKPDQWIASKSEPSVDIGLSVTEDSLTCLHCGEQFSMLKRHIARHHRQTPDDYRAYWGLPPDYPMASLSYAESKREEAKDSGLGKYIRGPKPEKAREGPKKVTAR